MRRLASALVVAITVLVPSAVVGQVSVMPKLGTPGVGADLAVRAGDWLVLRAGGAMIPYEPRFTLSDIRWSVDFPPNAVGALDLHPFGSRFRISAGAFYLFDDLLFDGDFDGAVDVGGERWEASEVGSLRGAVAYDELSPFVSVGFGRAAGAGAAMFIEIGAAFIGEPGVELASEGGTRSDDPAFRAALQRQAVELEADVREASFYPILNVGLRLGL